MNIRERYIATMNFEEVDRPPLVECGYWGATIQRFCREGLVLEKGFPEDVRDGDSVSPWLVPEIDTLLGLERFIESVGLNAWFNPPFEEEVLEDHGEWVLMRNMGGAIERQRKDRLSIPVMVSGPVKNRDDWEQIKAERLQPDLTGRLPKKGGPRFMGGLGTIQPSHEWSDLVAENRDRDYLLTFGEGGFQHWCFGLVRLVGFEQALLMLHDDPDFVRDIMNDLTEFWVALLDQVLRQVVPDVVFVGGDFCDRTGPMMSPAAFREFMFPGFQALSSIMRDYGVPSVIVHTDGDVRQLMPLFVESGVTGLHPFEATNGQDIVEIRKAFPRFQIFGGLDKKPVISGDKEAIDLELEAKLPFMLSQGGYIPFLDHAVSPDISWENFVYYRTRVNEYVEKARQGH